MQFDKRFKSVLTDNYDIKNVEILNYDERKGEPVEIKPLYTGDPDRTNPAVAGGHTNYFVAWEHMRNNTAFRDIHGRLFAPHVVFLPLSLRNYSH